MSFYCLFKILFLYNNLFFLPFLLTFAFVAKIQKLFYNHKLKDKKIKAQDKNLRL